MQISFCLRKLRSTSYKDADLFLFQQKVRSTSYKDADLFLFQETPRSTPNKNVDLFYFKKKNCSHVNLLTFKKKIKENCI